LPQLGIIRPTERIAVFDNVVFIGNGEFTVCQAGPDASSEKMLPVFVRVNVKDGGTFRLDKLTPSRVARATQLDVEKFSTPSTERRSFWYGVSKFSFEGEQLVFAKFDLADYQVGNSPDGPFYSSLDKKTLVEVFGEPIRYGKNKLRMP